MFGRVALFRVQVRSRKKHVSSESVPRRQASSLWEKSLLKILIIGLVPSILFNCLMWFSFYFVSCVYFMCVRCLGRICAGVGFVFDDCADGDPRTERGSARRWGWLDPVGWQCSFYFFAWFPFIFCHIHQLLRFRWLRGTSQLCSVLTRRSYKKLFVNNIFFYCLQLDYILLYTKNEAPVFLSWISEAYLF